MKNNILLSHTLFEGAGETWTDVLSYQSLGKEDKYKFPSKIILDYVQFVDRIQLEYADKKLPVHGGNPNEKLEISLSPDEYVQSVTCEYCKFGSSNYMICTLLFKTNKKESGFKSFYQPKDKVKAEYTFPPGFALACLAGKSDYYNTQRPPCIAGLTLYFAPIKNNPTAFGIVNPDFSYLKVKEYKALPEDIHYTLEFPTTKQTQLACAYIKVIEGNATFTVTGKNGHSITSGGDAQSQVSTDNNQTVFILNNPIEENWQFHVNAQKGCKFKIEASAINLNMPSCTILKYCDRLTAISDEIITSDDLAQPMKEALTELAIRKYPELEPQNSRHPLGIGSTAALAHLLHTCMAFTPWIVVGGIAILGSSYLIYKLIQNAQAEDVNPKKMKSDIEKGIGEESKKEYTKKGFWDWKPSSDVYQDIAGWKKEYPDDFLYDESTKELYDDMYQRFGGIEISKISSDRYIDEDFLRKYNSYLHIDIGGEGCYMEDGNKYGFETAIVLSGRKENFYVHRNIPMLLHVNDWTKDTFPFKDNTVTRITIQGITSPLTKKEADEIVRCINKNTGLIEVWTDKSNIKLIATVSYIADKLNRELKIEEAINSDSAFPKYYINLKS